MMSLIIVTLLIFVIAVITSHIVDRAGLWILVRMLSLRSLAMHRRFAGGNNRLFLHGLNTPENCVTPLSVADAMIMFCVFDLSRGPLQITVPLPKNRYWSITCYGIDTTNFFSINATNPEMSRATTAVIYLSHARRQFGHQHSADRPVNPGVELLAAESASRQGLVLIRVVLNKPEDTEEAAYVSTALKQSTTAIQQSDSSTWKSSPCTFAGPV